MDNVEAPAKRNVSHPRPLNPMEMNVEKDDGIYIEPNVWMVHEIG
jgi:hypothetical protein